MCLTRALLPIVVTLVAGCAVLHDPSYDPTVAYPQKEIFDILETALRYRLATMPLPRHSRCNVFIESANVAIVSFARRFPEYQMIVKRNSPGNSPPPRWYYIRLGKTTQNDAWVDVSDASGGMEYHLRREGGRWVVVFARVPVII